MRYTTNNDWIDVDAINRLAYNNLHPHHGHDGAEILHQIFSQTFTNLSIDGYPVAGWIQNDVDDEARAEITFSPDPPAYANYSNFDTWIKAPSDPLWITCPRPTSVQATAVSSSSATLTWQAGTNNTHYLLLYQPQGDQPWEFLPTTSNSVTLTGLSSGTPYDVQIVAGCSAGSDERGLSGWATASFTTN